MIAPPVEPADLGQREVGQLTGKEDRHLPSAEWACRAGRADQLGWETPKSAATFCWICSTGVGVFDRVTLGDHLGDQLGAERLGHQRGVGDDPG